MGRFALLLSALCLLSLSLTCDADPLPKTIDGKPTQQFIQAFTADYTGQMDSLLAGFSRFKEKRDYQGFYFFKAQWLEKYSPKRKHYEQLLERNHPALVDSGLDKLIAGFINLDLSAMALWSYLRQGDQAKLETVKTYTHETIQYLGQLDKEHHLKLKLK